jgi:hypothetical protein
MKKLRLFWVGIFVFFKGLQAVQPLASSMSGPVLALKPALRSTPTPTPTIYNYSPSASSRSLEKKKVNFGDGQLLTFGQKQDSQNPKSPVEVVVISDAKIPESRRQSGDAMMVDTTDTFPEYNFETYKDCIEKEQDLLDAVDDFQTNKGVKNSEQKIIKYLGAARDFFIKQVFVEMTDDESKSLLNKITTGIYVKARYESVIKFYFYFKYMWFYYQYHLYSTCCCSSSYSAYDLVRSLRVAVAYELKTVDFDLKKVRYQIFPKIYQPRLMVDSSEKMAQGLNQSKLPETKIAFGLYQTTLIGDFFDSKDVVHKGLVMAKEHANSNCCSNGCVIL